MKDVDLIANCQDHNENGHTPLMEAASAGHCSVARLLLEFGAGINTHSNEFKVRATLGQINIIQRLSDFELTKSNKSVFRSLPLPSPATRVTLRWLDSCWRPVLIR